MDRIQGLAERDDALAQIVPCVPVGRVAPQEVGKQFPVYLLATRHREVSEERAGFPRRNPDRSVD